ncbi:MAG: glycerol-3-phosphate acyltransferase [Chloroflexi bacterium]|jgi:glycerol-3-phosphate acyltransferase PlsY|nr:glycerol-3-phosphate acyltransferase [Chloroflexota bacterium]
MDLGVAALAAAVGYLCGSISFARIVARIRDPRVDVTRVEVPLASGEVFVSDSVSASAVRLTLGPRYGILTALLDMAKVALPTLLFRIWIPEPPYFLIVAAAGLVGHDRPVFFRFKGGRGESAIYGGMLVIDPLAVVGTTILGALVGFIVGNILVLRWAGMVLLIPWLWVATGSPWYLAYIVFAVGWYLLAMRPELAQYGRMRGKGTDPTNEEIAIEFGMGRRLGRALDRYAPLPALARAARGSDRPAG